MNRILVKSRLSENVYRMRLEAPLVAQSRRAGQFVIVRADDAWGERIPLTIADADPVAGTIDIVFQTVGVSTKKLALLNEGDALAGVTGPLGRPTEILSVKRAIVIGGGIGIAPAHPIAQAFKAAGSRVTAIIGARTRELVIMEDEMRRASDELVVVTDDGSYGRKGLVTEPLKEILESSNRRIDESSNDPIGAVIVVGPPVMMKFCAETTRPFGVKTVASLNAVMIDGTGMCGGCRVTVGGETKFVCVDGPEFDAHAVDWTSFIRRLGAFKREEQDHKCRSGLF